MNYKKEKKPILINMSFLAEISQEELDKEFGLLDIISNKIEKKCEKIGKRINLKWESSQNMILDKDVVNCGRCSNCNCWVTDIEKPNPEKGLNRGTIYNDRLLCDECLPKGHKHAF